MESSVTDKPNVKQTYILLGFDYNLNRLPKVTVISVLISAPKLHRLFSDSSNFHPY